MESLWVAKTGLEAQQTRLSVISQNLANINTTGLQARSRDLRGLALPERHAAGRAHVPADQCAHGPEPRHRRADGRDGQAVLAGQSHHDDQSARYGDRGPRLLPDPDAGRHAGVYARRHVPDQRAGTGRHVARLPASAVGHDSERRGVGDGRRRRRRVGGAAGAKPAGAGRHLPAQRLRESRRPPGARREPATSRPCRAGRRRSARRA